MNADGDEMDEEDEDAENGADDEEGGASKGGYTTSTGTDWHSQMWRKLFVPMSTSSSGRL